MLNKRNLAQLNADYDPQPPSLIKEKRSVKQSSKLRRSFVGDSFLPTRATQMTEKIMRDQHVAQNQREPSPKE